MSGDALALSAPAPVPSCLAGPIRHGFETFLLLQSTRYAQREEEPLCSPGAVLPSEGHGTSTALAGLSMAGWCETYRQHLAPLNSKAVDELWGLVSTVLRILEDGSAHTVNAGQCVREWCTTARVDAEYVAAKLAELDELQLDDCAPDEIESAGFFFMDLIEHCFFVGAFEASARLIDSFMRALRRASPHNPFSADVETCIALVKELLHSSYSDAHTFARWRQSANDLVYEAKRVLTKGREDSLQGGLLVRVAGQLCVACLHLVLAISGDMQLVRDDCREMGLSFIDYLAALCVLATPYCSLAELSAAAEEARNVWGDDADNDALHDIALLLLGVQRLEDVVMTMADACERANTHLQWAPSNLLREAAGREATDDSSDDSDSLNADGGESICVEDRFDGDSASIQYFALVFMAAHVSDLCSPAVAASSPEIALTFARNDAIATYVDLFARDPMLWEVAATYVAHAPLMNPAILFNITNFAAQAAAADTAKYTELSTFFRTMFDETSPHQQQVRRLLQARLPDHPTVSKWVDVFRYYRKEAWAGAHHYIITCRLNQCDYAMAAWLSVEAQVPNPLEIKLKRLLCGATVLTDDCVYGVGEALLNGYVAVDVSPTADLARYLAACEAVAEYRRAAIGVRGLQEDPMSSVETTLGACAWCLESVEKVLTRTDDCSTILHPSPLFDLVEHAADLLLYTRDILHRLNQPAYAHLATPMQPGLLHAFSLCRVHHGSRITTELQSRARSIAEKLARSCESHTS